MKYPKPIMSITEMVPLGFSRDELKKMIAAKGQKFATITSGGGKWLIDTEEFESWRKNR